jgi:hypothetical protein
MPSGFAEPQCGKACLTEKFSLSICVEAQPRRKVFGKSRRSEASLTALERGRAGEIASDLSSAELGLF